MRENMGTPYSKEIQAAVIEARLAGMLVKDICRKFHVYDQTIRDWMKADANVVGRTSLKKNTDQIIDSCSVIPRKRAFF